MNNNRKRNANSAYGENESMLDFIYEFSSSDADSDNDAKSKETSHNEENKNNMKPLSNNIRHEEKFVNNGRGKKDSKNKRMQNSARLATTSFRFSL